MIRKISVRNDEDKILHFLVGQKILRKYTLSLIRKVNDTYEIYLSNDEEGTSALWKTFNTSLVVSVENKIQH